jgi:hypothetical protein
MYVARCAASCQAHWAIRKRLELWRVTERHTDCSKKSQPKSIVIEWFYRYLKHLIVRVVTEQKLMQWRIHNIARRWVADFWALQRCDYIISQEMCFPRSMPHGRSSSSTCRQGKLQWRLWAIRSRSRGLEPREVRNFSIYASLQVTFQKTALVKCAVGAVIFGVNSPSFPCKSWLERSHSSPDHELIDMKYNI